MFRRGRFLSFPLVIGAVIWRRTKMLSCLGLGRSRIAVQLGRYLDLGSRVVNYEKKITFDAVLSEIDEVRQGAFLLSVGVGGGIRIGVVSGKAIFGPPLEEYWTKKLQEEAAKKGDASTS